LITAGPTWVAIDRVRVISNIATAETGRLLAEQAKRLGAKVTLLAGPVGAIKVSKGIRILRFNFFDELFSLLRKELKSQSYDCVVHSAAVSDYRPKITFKHKLKSGKRNLGLELSPTLRIVDKIKKLSPAVFLVAFKLELGLSGDRLVKEAGKLLKRAGADLVIANTFAQNRYSAAIIDKAGKVAARASSKPGLVRKLVQTIEDKL
jgi:phosphopantothenoylcysteine synthetase/decarboxylase